MNKLKYNYLVGAMNGVHYVAYPHFLDQLGDGAVMSMNVLIRPLINYIAVIEAEIFDAINKET